MQSKTFFKKNAPKTAEPIEKLTTFLGSLRLSRMRDNGSLRDYRDRWEDTGRYDLPERRLTGRSRLRNQHLERKTRAVIGKFPEFQ